MHNTFLFVCLESNQEQRILDTRDTYDGFFLTDLLHLLRWMGLKWLVFLIGLPRFDWYVV
jgi:hypothetical protein